MDYILIEIAKMVSRINTEGIINLESSSKEDVGSRCLNIIIDLLKNAIPPNYFNFVIDYEFNKILRESNANESEIKIIYAIKHIAPMILRNEIIEILTFSKSLCGYKVHDEMFILLRDFIEEF